MVNEADILNALNLGTSKEILNNSPKSPLVDLLDRLAQDVTDQLTKSLDKYDANASYNLRQSIKPTESVVDENGVSVAITADFYWKFVQYGVNGWMINRGTPTWGAQPTQPNTFHENIVLWMRDRGITPRDPRDTIESVGWGIVKKIKRDGIEARPFFTDVVNAKTVDYLRAPIEKVLKRAIEIRIVEPWQ